MIKLGFIIPFISKAYSRDWLLHQRLLSNTLASISNQTDQSYLCYVVTSEKQLDIEFDNRVKVIEYPYQRLTYDQLVGYSPDGYIDIDHIERNYDIGKKAHYGCQIAIEDGCTHVMKVDADDLISNRLVAHLKKYSILTNYYIPKGYAMHVNSRYLFTEDALDKINGSTNIVAVEYLPSIDFNSRNINDFNWFTSHDYLKHRLRGNGAEVISIPFRAVIYVKHHAGVSQTAHLFRLGSLKGMIKLLTRGTKITKNLIEEFSINQLSQSLE